MHELADLEPCLVVDLEAIAANYRTLDTLAPGANTGAAVKANAYGLGAGPVAKQLYMEGCRDFFVATPGEGKVLRSSLPQPDATIWVLNGYRSELKQVFDACRLSPVLNQLGDVKDYIAAPTHAPSALHIDTGMNRLGLAMHDLKALFEERLDALNIALVMSHLARSEDQNHPFNQVQLDTFKAIIPEFADVKASLSNTGGIYLGANYHFDLNRPGIGLYGATAQAGQRHGLKPVVALEASIVQIRHVRKGESVGYGQSFIAPGDMVLACVGAGYGDGLPRALSNQGRGFINTLACPIIGKVSMDLTMIDITGLRDIQIGHRVQFIGPDLDDIAEQSGTIAYEILTGLESRGERQYRPLDFDRESVRSSASNLGYN